MVPSDRLQVSPAWDDGAALRATVDQMDLEGIIAKRKEDLYTSRTRWYKIKNPTYWRLHEERAHYFRIHAVARRIEHHEIGR